MRTAHSTLALFTLALAFTMSSSSSAETKCLSDVKVIVGNFSGDGTTEGQVGFIRTSPDLEGASAAELRDCPNTHEISYSVSGFVLDQLRIPLGNDSSLKSFTPVVGKFAGRGTDAVFYHRNSPHEWRVYPGASAGAFAVHGTFTDGRSYGPEYELLTGDFNGDGKTDFMMHRKSPHEAVAYISQDQSYNGNWSISTQSKDGLLYTANPLPLVDGNDGVNRAEEYKTYVGDFNGDGKSDYMIHRNYPHETSVYLGRVAPGGQFYFEPRTLQSQDGLAYGPEFKVFTGDFNGDGKTDYMLHRKSPHETSVYFGRVAPDGRFYFEARTAPQSQDGSSYGIDHKVLVKDFNVDGKADYMVYNQRSHELNVYLSRVDGRGVFSFAPKVVSGKDGNDFSSWTMVPGSISFNTRDNKVDIYYVRAQAPARPGDPLSIMAMFYKWLPDGRFAPVQTVRLSR